MQALSMIEVLRQDTQDAQAWFRRHERAIRAAGIDAAPDSMVPF